MYRIIFILMLICANAYAELPAPPKLKDGDRALQQYLTDLYNNKSVIPVTTTAPNGNRKGRVGELVIYGDHVWYNASSSTVWIIL